MKLIAATVSLFMLVANGASGQTASASGASQTAPVQNSETIRIARSASLQSNKGSAQYSPARYRFSSCFPLTIHRAQAAGK